jgi:hypothetical protein
MEPTQKPIPPWIAGPDPVADLLEEVERVRGLSLTERGAQARSVCWASAQICAAREPAGESPPQEPRSAQSLRDWLSAMERPGEQRD